MTWDTRASFNGASAANGVAAAKNNGMHQRPIDLQVNVWGANLFISVSYCDARAASGPGFDVTRASLAGRMLSPLRGKLTSDHVTVTTATNRGGNCQFTCTAGGLFEPWLLLGQAFFTASHQIFCCCSCLAAECSRNIPCNWRCHGRLCSNVSPLQ